MQYDPQYICGSFGKKLQITITRCQAAGMYHASKVCAYVVDTHISTWYQTPVPWYRRSSSSLQVLV